MIRYIAWTLCAGVALLAGAASLPEAAHRNRFADSVDKSTTDVAAHSGGRSGYIVASS